MNVSGTYLQPIDEANGLKKSYRTNTLKGQRGSNKIIAKHDPLKLPDINHQVYFGSNVRTLHQSEQSGNEFSDQKNRNKSPHFNNDSQKTLNLPPENF